MEEAKLSLYLTFHLNLAYSSISPEQHADVIKKCYWPLLDTIATGFAPIGIEASAYTLECINAISPTWLQRFQILRSQKKCELIGSGYCQLIGPLVPAGVNAANLSIGNTLYDKLLGIQPRIALINEQAWSTGLLDTYIDNNYDAVIMEWNNPNYLHPEWVPEIHYHPQEVLSHTKRPLSLIWNDSIVFQKFQRLIHGESSVQDLISYLHSHWNGSPRCLSLYGNDAEIFNFRPGRFTTEPRIEVENEWQQIRELFSILRRQEWIEFILPSAVLEKRFCSHEDSPLKLCTAQVPIPVKKQNKYNAIRWAVSGRDDLILNTYCQQLYERIASVPSTKPQWKELCYYWSSDFRTHISEPRYTSLLSSLKRACLPAPDVHPHTTPTLTGSTYDEDKSWIKVQEHQRHLEIISPLLRIVLQTTKGLAIRSLQFSHISEESLLGTIEHGFFEDMNYAADFFSGHLTADNPGQHQITDLHPVAPVVTVFSATADIKCIISTPLFKMTKTFTLFRHSPEIRLNISILFNQKPGGTVRLGYITLNPRCFDKNTLFFSTHNGGKEMESFFLNNEIINHFDPVSSLVSATTCLGITENVLYIGDKTKRITLKIDKSVSNCVGGIQYIPMGDTFLLRHIFSAMEHDDTRVPSEKVDRQKSYQLNFSLNITASET
jgi:hypothetical protein